MPYIIKLYREGALIEHPAPYEGHVENAKHLAIRRGQANNADFVRILDDSGKLEIWSERLEA